MPSGSLEEAVFLAAWSAWNGDSNKMGNGNANAKVREFLRGGHDQRLDGSTRGSIPEPYVVFYFGSATTDALGPGTVSALSLRAGEGVAEFHYFWRRDQGKAFPAGVTPSKTDADHFVQALRVLIHEKSVQTAGLTTMGWLMDYPVRISGGPAPSDGRLNHWVERYAMGGKEISSVSET